MTLDYIRDPAAITRASFEIIAAECDFDRVPSDVAPVIRRIVHACGMTDILADLAWSNGAGEAGRVALTGGAPIICDTRMVAAGIMSAHLPAENAILTGLDAPDADRVAREHGTTRSAAGITTFGARLGGALVAVGNAPTALFRLLELLAEGAPRPALVLGFPVGFVGAAESKVALARSDLPFITLHGRRGGSAIAAAAVNALLLG